MFFFFHVFRFRSDADLGGTEKVAICDPSGGAMLDSTYEPMPPLNPESSLLSCNLSTVFVFIGWKHGAGFSSSLRHGATPIQHCICQGLAPLHSFAWGPGWLVRHEHCCR